MALACINCFMVPLEVAVEIEYFQESIEYKIINILIDIIFIIDLAVNMNTSYEEEYTIISNRRKIIEKYIKSRFTIDFLSALPIDYIAAIFFSSEASSLKIFSLLKLVRMLRLSRIIRALNVRRELKTKIKLFKVFFQLILYLHC